MVLDLILRVSSQAIPILVLILLKFVGLEDMGISFGSVLLWSSIFSAIGWLGGSYSFQMGITNRVVQKSAVVMILSSITIFWVTGSFRLLVLIIAASICQLLGTYFWSKKRRVLSVFFGSRILVLLLLFLGEIISIVGLIVLFTIVWRLFGDSGYISWQSHVVSVGSYILLNFESLLLLRFFKSELLDSFIYLKVIRLLIMLMMAYNDTYVRDNVVSKKILKWGNYWKSISKILIGGLALSIILFVISFTIIEIELNRIGIHLSIIAVLFYSGGPLNLLILKLGRNNELAIMFLILIGLVLISLVVFGQAWYASTFVVILAGTITLSRFTLLKNALKN